MSTQKFILMSIAGAALLGATAVVAWGYRASRHVVFRAQQDRGMTAAARLRDGAPITLLSTPTPTPFSSPIPPAPQFFFVGDIMTGRNVELLMDAQGPDYPFLGASGVLPLARDGVVANLEGPVNRMHVRTPSGSYVFSLHPKTPEALVRAGVVAVSLGNNHLTDQKQAGLHETRETLAMSSISVFGDPVSATATYTHVRDVRGSRVAFLGFNATWPSFKEADALSAIHEADTTASYTVVHMHWGAEYVLVANAMQRRLARALIDAGADLVIGHHPHVVQDVDVWKGRLIFYSLGNFVFDQYFSRDTQEGLGVLAECTPTGTRATLVPFASVRSQPRPMEPSRSAAFLAALAARSRDAGTPADIASSIAAGELAVVRSNP